MKRLLIVNGGGDCPGLNAVTRAIVKRAAREGDWEVLGSIEAYHGLLREPEEVMHLGEQTVEGIHYRGGTIIGTTNKGDPFSYPIQKMDGTWETRNLCDDVLKKVHELNIDAVVSVGGDGSQKISKRLFDLGLKVVGVPKTIDNDLSATDQTFGFQTAVEIATDAVDKLMTTAASHNRIMILEVMGRSAGWIALHAAVAGGAHVCLIPEIPYDINKVLAHIQKRYIKGRGYAIVVVAEGAHGKEGQVVFQESGEVGYENKRLGGIGFQLGEHLKQAGCEADIRVNVLGHIQRGGVPVAFDRILASMFGVKAFELVLEEKFGQMVSLKGNQIVDVSLEEATKAYNYVDPKSFLVETARGVGINMGD